MITQVCENDLPVISIYQHRLILVTNHSNKNTRQVAMTEKMTAASKEPDRTTWIIINDDDDDVDVTKDTDDEEDEPGILLRDTITQWRRRN